MPPKESTGAGFAKSAGLTLFVATGLLLGALVVSGLAVGLGSVRAIAVATSTFAGMVACFVMFIDALDLWIRGRQMTPHTQKLLLRLVLVAVVAAFGLSIVGRNPSLLLLMAPSLILYLATVRKPAAARASRRSTKGASGGRRTAPSGSRQKRGGKKRR